MLLNKVYDTDFYVGSKFVTFEHEKKAGCRNHNY